MYQALLTRVYLTSKVMPLLAALAVALCSTMVLVVWSVMGGFLGMLLNQGRGMMGDVSFTWPTTGFAHYEQFIARLEADGSKVAAATPLIDTLAMATMPDNKVVGVKVLGIDPRTYSKVVDFDSSIWWRPLTEPMATDKERKDPRLDPQAHPRLARALDEARALARLPQDPGAAVVPGAIVGIELTGYSQRDRTGAGFYGINSGLVRPTADGGVMNVGGFAGDQTLTLRVVPFDASGREVALVPAVFPIVNEFRVGLHFVDSNQVFVDLTKLQRMLKMDAGTVVSSEQQTDDLMNPVTPRAGSGPKIRASPPRVTTVLVRAAPGVSPDALRAHVLEVYREFARDFPLDVPRPEIVEQNKDLLVRTWEMQNATLVGAVKKETALVLLLLWLISLVASFLILAIFWAMISEKTKDIGTLRAIGASGPGIAGIWIGFGLILGLVGAVVGVALAWVIVTNINPIHEWLGSALGIYVWDPKVYYFTTIPNTVDPQRALIVGLAGVGFALLGAIIPAIRAAAMKPVTALRFE